MATPPLAVLLALNAPTTRHVRRVEIYEADGTTRWNADTKLRFIDGSISVDYGRDERRALDLTLDNSDHSLVHAPGQFWYDKIIKCYRGVEVRQSERPPRVIIVSGADADIIAFRSALVALGFDDIRVNTLASTLTDLTGYELVVSLGGAGAIGKASLLLSAYNAGMSVFTQGAQTPQASLPFVTATSTGSGMTQWHILANRAYPHQLTVGWPEEYWTMSNAASNVIPTAVDSSAWPVSSDSGKYTILAATNTNGLGGKWINMATDLHLSSPVQQFFLKAFDWLNPWVPIETWETQVGEFMIDKFGEGHFPHQVHVSGRDYTKKCLASKFTQATEFSGTNTPEGLISAIAANAGITKKVLPPTGTTTTRTFYYDRGVPRWEAMKDIADAFMYDVYFDRHGYLRMKAQGDPATFPPVYTLSTGTAGNMASYEKSADDSRLYNHVLVTGAAPDDNSLPVWAEAKNTDPNSPTSIPNIGDRLYQYDSTFITTTAQAQAVATQFLAVHSLEVFSLNFESLLLPWLDVGEIIQFTDPYPAPGDPVNFLLQSLTIPMGLGLMSGTAGRVLIK